MRNQLSLRRLLCAATCCLIVGCPAQPPATQGARTPAEFVTKLKTHIPLGTSRETALQRLRYREGITGKDVSVGDFVTDADKPEEKTHNGIRFIEFESMIATVNREWQTVKFAIVIEDDQVSHYLFNVIKTEPMPEPKGKQR